MVTGMRMGLVWTVVVLKGKFSVCISFSLISSYMAIVTIIWRVFPADILLTQIQ